MSVYNGEKYLADSLESILNQTHRNLELIIVNDGSRDDSLEIIQNYMKVDKRIILIDQKNLGLTKSLNIAISVATGEYIARQDADDVSAPNRLKLFVNFLLKNKNIEIYSTPGILINENGRLIKTIPNYFRRNGFNQKMMDFHNSLIHGTMIIRSDIIKNHKYDENFVYSQDFELYHRLMNLEYIISYDNNNISYMLRTHLDQISSKVPLLQGRNLSKILKIYTGRSVDSTLTNRLYFRLLDVVFYINKRISNVAKILK